MRCRVYLQINGENTSIAKLCRRVFLLQRGKSAFPAEAAPEETLGYFARMRELQEQARAADLKNTSMDVLSMGMSQDYAAAISQGATMVRIGTAIYGPRDYSQKGI